MIERPEFVAADGWHAVLWVHEPRLVIVVGIEHGLTVDGYTRVDTVVHQIPVCLVKTHVLVRAGVTPGAQSQAIA